MFQVSYRVAIMQTPVTVGLGMRWAVVKGSALPEEV